MQSDAGLDSNNLRPRLLLPIAASLADADASAISEGWTARGRGRISGVSATIDVDFASLAIHDPAQ